MISPSSVDPLMTSGDRIDATIAPKDDSGAMISPIELYQKE
jgi:hypothetical protein